MDILSDDTIYMRRALQLAACGYGHTFTNPMVGAVIVAPDGRIIGEGWHRRYGGPHAEVNAVRSVSAADRHLLPESTIYVTLEPCSHFGKTPPCSSMLIRERLRRVVVGASDPFPEVAGRGLKMLRDAGCEVTTGVMEQECIELNLHFMTAHRLGRPFVMLKWAQSADGYIGTGITDDGSDNPSRLVFSSMLGQLAVHRLRASFQGVMAGVNTVIADNPRLDCRLWPTLCQPVAISQRSRRIPADARILQRDHILREPSESLAGFLRRLYTEQRFNAILVEGGHDVLQEFIRLDLFDAIRVETSPSLLGHGVKAPDFNPSALNLKENLQIGGNSVMLYRHRH